MADQSLVNGQIIDSMRTKVGEALLQKSLTKKDRLQYEILQLMVMFFAEDHPKIKTLYSAYETSKDDHMKVQKMYTVFVPMAWAFLIMAAAVLTGFATGKITFVFTQ